MNFLKTLFWIVLSAMIVLFSIGNWRPVSVSLWGGLQADIKLPVLLLVVFLLGFVPALVYYRAKHWRLTRRLGSVERELSDLRGISRFRAPERVATPADASGAELTLDKPLPPGAEQ